MKRRYHQSEDDSGIEMTPMLDVVFIMLIFFIVTSSFVKESGVEVSKPAAATAVRSEQGNILVAITSNNIVWIDKRQVELGAVRANIERLHAENPQGTVIIQADRASQNGVLVTVIDQVRLAGIANVAIAADEIQR